MKNHLRTRRFTTVAGMSLLLWFLVGYILFPALKTFEVSITGDDALYWGHYLQLLTNEHYRTPLINSIVLGILSVLVCGVIGTSLAFFVHYFEFPGKAIIDRLLFLPMMLPGIIIVFSFLQLYGESGLITKTIQIVFGLDGPPSDFQACRGSFLSMRTHNTFIFISASRSA